MERFEYDKSTVTLNELMMKGVYSRELLEALNKGKYQELYTLSASDRANRDLMEPLLYAVRNENGTYAVYTYFSESLQNDTALAAQIIQTEPQLIEGTPISQNKEFVMAHVSSNPNIVAYISPTLKRDTDIIQEAYQTRNANAIEALEQEGVKVKMIQTILDNPKLSNDKEFMTSAIEKSGDVIALASDELKDNYEFLRQAYKVNIEAVDYTAEHTEDFGVKGLLAAKEVIIENSSDNAIKGFTDERDKTQEQLRVLRQENKPENLEAIKKLELDEKRFQRHIRFIEKIKSGEIDQVKAAKRIRDFCAKLDPEYRKRIEQMLTIDTAMQQKEQDSPKQITTQEIKDVATNFEKMEGKTPQSEIREVKDAIKEPAQEEKNKDNESLRQ